jgi:glyoxylase-like metal-dependent hydrolase (beta-lactamase superfamily II)
VNLPVADRWFELERVDHAITRLVEPHVHPFMRCNIWHVRGRDRDLVVDTGMGVASLRDAADHLFRHDVVALATHVHADHVGGHHEFAQCWCHRLEADGLEAADGAWTLADVHFDVDDLSTLRTGAYALEGALLTAIPHAGWNKRGFRIRPAKVTRRLDEGDVVDLGDRAFEVLHLPGHSPGSIGLWEATTGTLFSGDTLYDGPLADNFEKSDPHRYVHTLERLRGLPVQVVHAGHEASFGRARLQTLIDDYLHARSTT